MGKACLCTIYLCKDLISSWQERHPDSRLVLGRVQAVSHLSTIPSILEGGNLLRDCMTPSQEAVQVPVGCVPLARLLEET